MLYSAKEKINHLRNLMSEDHAHIDVELLKSKQTDIYQIAHWSKFPKKYAREILAALLEIVPAEDIRLNRRSVEDQAIRDKEDAERKAKEEEERKAKEEAERLAKEEEEKIANPESERLAEEDDKRRIKEEAERKAQEYKEDHQAKLDEKDELIEEKDEEIDELKDKVVELEQQVEDLHEQNLKAPAEKKSNARKNTRKSNGKK